MKIEVHLLTHDDEQMIEWSVRHYQQFADYIVVHDGGPSFPFTVAKQLIDDKFVTSLTKNHVVDHQEWHTAGELNDELARKLKNSCWLGTDADWVIVVDADELLHFPKGASETLSVYEKVGAVVIKTHGFEMFSDEWFDPEWNPGLQLTDLVKDGAPEDKWYAKPCLFSPKRVRETGFGIGAHESEPVLKEGRRVYVGADWPKANPPTYLLHFKSIFGGLERIAERYDATRSRLALCNVRNGWGNMKDGRVHAQEKRDLLLPHVRRVLP